MHDDAFFKVVYIPLASSWTSFHRSTARWRYLVNRQSLTDGALWYLNWSSWTSCLIKLDSFIFRTTDVAHLGLMNFILLIYRVCWAIILSHITVIECFSRLWAPSLIQFDLLTQVSSVLVLDMRWRLIRFGYSWSLNLNQCILFIISLAAYSRQELAMCRLPVARPTTTKTSSGKVRRARLREPVAARLKDAVLHSAHRTI